MLQTANSAQSIYNISQQASLYVPLTTLPTSLPSYISMNGASKWHTSALQVLALETITLPTRLRGNENGRASFGDVETVLSNDGNRRIAALSLSLEDPAVHETAANGDERHASNGHFNGDAEDSETVAPELDIDMYPDVTAAVGGRPRTTKTHVFSQLQSLRGKWLSTLEIDDTNIASRNRFSNAPRVQRLVHYNNACLGS